MQQCMDISHQRLHIVPYINLLEVSCPAAGVDKVWKRDSAETRDLPEKRAESHLLATRRRSREAGRCWVAFCTIYFTASEQSITLDAHWFQFLVQSGMFRAPG